jgi:hypothetical protein
MNSGSFFRFQNAIVGQCSGYWNECDSWIKKVAAFSWRARDA